MTTENAIEIRNLHVRYGEGKDFVEALRGINLTVRRGEKVAIIGRSGGGKSSLLRVLSGLVPVDSGEVRVGPHLFDANTPAPRALYQEVGVVFQNYGLVPQLSALQNVLCGRLKALGAISSLGRFPREDRARAIQLLTDLGLKDRIHTRASRLSGGEQQRVGIARLLLQRAELMLLDEPVASLDIHWAAHALKRLCTEAPEDTAVVMVLHDLWMARRFADRVIFIHDGKIAFDGDPEEGCRHLEALQATEETPPLADGSVHLQPPTPLPGLPTLSAPEINSLESGLLQRYSFYALIAVAALVLYFWAARGVSFSLGEVFSNLPNAADFLGRMLPPDFSAAAPVSASLLETIQMALLGTTLAAVISLPIAVMAARNISSRPVQAVARLLLNLLRTVPSIIWGLFFVVIVGLGPLAGVLALTFYAAGYLGKFYYEGIESIDPRPLQALRTVGATPFQRFRWGVFPQVLPLILGYTLYMFEYNVRAASILGIVGAGGIGFYLHMYVSFAQYDHAATALLLLLLVVTIIDTLSSVLRARLMD